MSLVYGIINKINNKKYIGITNYSNPERRWGDNGEGYKGTFFYENGIQKYGWKDGFLKAILVENIDEVLAQQVEARLIKRLNTRLDGYNDINGATIIHNEEADLLTEQAIQKIEQLTIPINDIEKCQINYSYATNTYNIDFLYNQLYKKRRINTDLDCQRGYTWTPERQQGMWDTLLRNHRIPEFHVIRDRQNYDVIDGKQRFTTIIKILDNEIPLNLNKVHPDLLFLRKYSTTETNRVFFNELPQEIKENILNIVITMAEYSNMDDQDLTDLFRKLNASMPLSDFAKGVANYVTIRTNFTRYLIKHPTIKNLFSEIDIRNSDDEKFLIRLMLLLKYGIGNIDLQPKLLCDYYEELTPSELTYYYNNFEKILDKTNIASKIKIRANASFLPIIYYIIIQEKLTNDEILQFFKEMQNTDFFVQGTNFDKKQSKLRYQHCMNKLQIARNILHQKEVVNE